MSFDYVVYGILIGTILIEAVCFIAMCGCVLALMTDTFTRPAFFWKRVKSAGSAVCNAGRTSARYCWMPVQGWWLIVGGRPKDGPITYEQLRAVIKKICKMDSTEWTNKHRELVHSLFIRAGYPKIAENHFGSDRNACNCRCMHIDHVARDSDPKYMDAEERREYLGAKKGEITWIVTR